MDAEALRAWWAHRQGLDGSLEGADAAEVLEASGWARSVGDAAPYLTLHARADLLRSEVDAAVAGLAVHELPSARGCTYVVPAAQYATALTVGQAAVDGGAVATARGIGVDDAEIDRLCTDVVDALEEPLDAQSLEDALGGAVRDLGPEGRGRGIANTLVVALAVLQSRGRIRRIPVTGRLDQPRARYARWDDGPLADGGPSVEDANCELAQLFLSWAAPATLGHVRSFTGLSAAATSAALASCDIVTAPVEGREDLVLLAEDLDELVGFEPPDEPQVALVAAVDGLFLLRRAPADHLDDGDVDHPLLKTAGRGFLDLPSPAIVDRGRLIGLWEFDVDAGTIAWATFQPASDAVRAAVAATEAWLRDDLGNAWNVGVDAPESRRSRVDALRAHGE